MTTLYWYDKYAVIRQYETRERLIPGGTLIHTKTLAPIDLRYEYIEVEVEARFWYGYDYRTDIAIVENRRFDNYIDYKIELAGERHPFEYGEFEIDGQYRCYYREASHYYKGNSHRGIFKYSPTLIVYPNPPIVGGGDKTAGARKNRIGRTVYQTCRFKRKIITRKYDS